jgi:CDP-paratose 2-epimerase
MSSAASDRTGHVLITGGCGFIGCNLADALAARGDEVMVFDNLSRAGVRDNAHWLKARHGEKVTVRVGDVTDEAAVRGCVRGARGVLHLAAQVAVTSSLDQPLTDFEINARGTLNVLEAVRTTDAAIPIVFASTNKVYGALMHGGQIHASGDRYRPRDPRLAEGIGTTMPLDFYSPYGCSKGAADQYVRDYARVFGLRTAVLRMSCIYGVRQFGNEDQGWIAHFLLRAIRRQPITIFGDGRQVRDALYIDDAVEAWLAALDSIDRISGSVFNLGGGPVNTVSLLELLALIEAMRGERPRTVFEGWRPGDQLWYVSNLSTIERALGWRPRVSLPEGLRRLNDWLESANAPGVLREGAQA